MCNVEQCARCRRDLYDCEYYTRTDDGLCRYYERPIDNSRMFARWYKFSGRIGRLEYVITLVGAVVLYFIVMLQVSFILSALGIQVESKTGLYVYSFGCMIPSVYLAIAAGVKRAHDSGVSSWYSLVPLIPLFLLNIFTIFIFCVGCIYLFKDKGEDGINLYGSNPAQPYAEQLVF